jgi:hypothetical protein
MQRDVSVIRQFGEGSYQQSEMILRQLLAEAGAGRIHEPAIVDPVDYELAADWGDLGSAENYVGYERAENFASASGAPRDKPQTYELPARLRPNEWGLSGNWTIKPEAALLNKPNGSVAYRFHARDLNLVMGPVTPGSR